MLFTYFWYITQATVNADARLCLSTNNNGSTVFPAFRVAKYLLDILDPFYFCGDDPHFFPYNLFSDNLHRSVATRAVPILIRHDTANFDHRKPYTDLFPDSFLVPLPYVYNHQQPPSELVPRQKDL